ncbi:MAG: glycosyltransferase family 2 protein [Saprospiraceae bacterium]|nr:glycosyltransferase family 2 protein [Saprospiraceae bacterium]
MANHLPKIYVQILNYRGWEDTIKCVRCFLAQEQVDIQILLIDNASPDESFEKLAAEFKGHPQVALLQSEENGGYAKGNNIGIAHLRSKTFDYLLISNNDVRLDDTCLLSSLVAQYEQLPKIAFIAPAMFVDGREDQKHQAWRLPRFRDEVMASLRILYFIGKRTIQTSRYQFPPTALAPQKVDCLSGSFFMGSKNIFEQVGGFDEHTFLYGEETILAHKIKDLELQNYLWRAKHYHHDQGSTTTRLHSLLQLQRYWLASTLYYQAHYRKLSGWKLLILKILYFCWVLETLLFQIFPKRTLRND